MGDRVTKTPVKRFSDLVVVGSGPAGLMAALSASQMGVHVLLLEKNTVLGKKLRLTGGGRCNIGNLEADPNLRDSYYGRSNFLRPAMRCFPPHQMPDFFSSRGLPLVLEEESKFYPQQGGALGVVSFFEKELRRNGVDLCLGEELKGFLPTDSGVELITNRRHLTSRFLLFFPGGCAYPQTGSSGDWIPWLKDMGVALRPFTPALSPLRLDPHPWADQSGVTLKNVSLTLLGGDQSCPSGFSEKQQTIKDKGNPSFRGDLLITPQGLSGPVAFNLSRSCSWQKNGSDSSKSSLILSFRPDTSLEHCLEEVHVWQKDGGDRLARNHSLQGVPRALMPSFLSCLGLNPEKRLVDFSHKEQTILAEGIKRLPLPFSGLFPFHQAMVSRGGILTSEVNPRTMQLIRYPSVFVGGEAVDIDGECGGYNIQACLSMGYLAGQSAAEQLMKE